MKYIILLLLSFPALADTVNGTFVAPTEREDNTPLAITEIQEHRLYVNGVFNQSIVNTETTFTTELGAGSYDLTMTTVDTDGRESAFSDPVQTIVLSAPKAPATITITITVR